MKFKKDNVIIVKTAYYKMDDGSIIECGKYSKKFTDAQIKTDVENEIERRYGNYEN